MLPLYSDKKISKQRGHNIGHYGQRSPDIQSRGAVSSIFSGLWSEL